jgi:hypothetical protein
MVPENRISRFLSRPDGLSSTPRQLRLAPRDVFPHGRPTSHTASPHRPTLFVNLEEPGAARSSFRRPPSLEEVRVHALLFERLAALRRRRRGFWGKLWAFLRGD